jgi:hypothetical protein
LTDSRWVAGWLVGCSNISLIMSCNMSSTIFCGISIILFDSDQTVRNTSLQKSIKYNDYKWLHLVSEISDCGKHKGVRNLNFTSSRKNKKDCPEANFICFSLVCSKCQLKFCSQNCQTFALIQFQHLVSSSKRLLSINQHFCSGFLTKFI